MFYCEGVNLFCCGKFKIDPLTPGESVILFVQCEAEVNCFAVNMFRIVMFFCSRPGRLKKIDPLTPGHDNKKVGP